MKKTLNKRIFAIVTLFFVLMCSILPFTLKKNRVYADTETIVTSFASSNHFVPIRNTADTRTDFFAFDFYFRQNTINANERQLILGVNIYDGSTAEVFTSVNIQYINNDEVVSTEIVQVTNLFTLNLSSSITHIILKFSFNENSTTYSFSLWLNVTENFISSMNLVHLYPSSNSYTNHIDYGTYSDLNSSGDIFSFYFPSDEDHLYTDRFYYLSSDYVNEQIFQNGKNEGIIIGREEGFDEGYNRGKIAGRAEGLNEGLSSNGNSFLNLLGAVVDAPVQALTGLLNFDILGFNMFNLFKGLITLSIILFVVRLVI